MSVRLVFLLFVFSLSGAVVADTVDPCYPEEWYAQQATFSNSWSHLPWKRIEQLLEERRILLEQISVLPQHKLERKYKRLGYHSLFVDAQTKAETIQLNVDVSFMTMLDSIALAPAFNPQSPHSEVYAFPKRFKIEVQAGAGTWVNREWQGDGGSLKWVEVVNWMAEDFPDPGPYPVFFSDIGLKINRVRVTVERGALESGVFALGELYLFSRIKGRMAANMAAWGDAAIQVSATESFSFPPMWELSYLNDGWVGFGVPLSEQRVESEDLMITFEADEAVEEPIQIVMDLGEQTRVGRIDLWPALPAGLAVPSFGFPGTVTVELAKDPDFSQPIVYRLSNASERIQHENLFSVICHASGNTRYVRISFEDLYLHEGRRILGLGEVSVYTHGVVSSVGSTLAAVGIPERYCDHLPRLVDGICLQRRILPETEWIKGLAMRRPLDRKLARVEQELARAREEWYVLRFRAMVLGSVVLLAGLAGVLLFHRIKLRRALQKVKQRITHDLHDEVGSCLGGIALIAGRIESGPARKEDLVDLSLLTREASASLREVVWVIDQETIHLSALVHKLLDRARLVLGEIELTTEVSEQFPHMLVPLPFKRHMTMFFKEVIHNCVRHSGATQAHVSIICQDNQFRLLVLDNGCGFDLAGEHEGWGLDSLRERARELSGQMTLRSEPGKGTSVELKVPLSAFQEEVGQFYRSSN